MLADYKLVYQFIYTSTSSTFMLTYVHLNTHRNKETYVATNEVTKDIDIYKHTAAL